MCVEDLRVRNMQKNRKLAMSRQGAVAVDKHIYIYHDASAEALLIQRGMVMFIHIVQPGDTLFQSAGDTIIRWKVCALSMA